MKNFWDARDHCRNEGAYLAYPTSDAENKFISGLNPTSGSWIGVNDIEKEGEWVLDNGSVISYKNWGSGQPTNGNALRDGAVIVGSNTTVNTLSAGEWFDGYKLSSRRFVCYFRIESKSIKILSYGQFPGI